MPRITWCKIFAGTLVSLLLLAATAAAADPELKQFTSRECHFSILMPGAPELSTSEVPTGAGTFTLHSFVVTGENDAAYMVGYCDYGSADTNKSPQTALEGARDGAVSNVGGTLITDTPIMLNGVPGRAFVCRNDEGLLFDSHIYFVNHRLYQVLIVTKKDYPAKYRDAFMNSFAIR